MKSRQLIILVTIFMTIGCAKESNLTLFLDHMPSNSYYQEEIVPETYQRIYGKWKLYDISGGFIGSGYPANYDYLEIKRIGIYGLIRNDSILEYGRIELDTSNVESTTIKFFADVTLKQDITLHDTEKYLKLQRDSLELISPCCDFYDFHYKKAN